LTSGSVLPRWSDWMPHWEYEVVVVNLDTAEGLAKMRTTLNGLGQEGWELVSLAWHGVAKYVAILKRM
jgi:hypothetical protein